jgi:hypothetical protein
MKEITCSSCGSDDYRENSFSETICNHCEHDMTDEIREDSGIEL